MHSSRSAVRMCRRPDCQGSATATLSFRYDTAEAVVHHLSDEPHPSRWDLCTAHADTLRVPRGWEHIDRRAPEPAVVQAPERRPNRYAELSARLPEIAAGSRRTGAEQGSGEGQAGGADQKPIPGQLVMSFAGAGAPGDDRGSGASGSAFTGNVVPLVRRGEVLDLVT